MKKRLVFAVFLTAVIQAHAVTSDSAFVFVNPDVSSFWRTSEGGAITVPVDYPEGATSATLEIVGIGHEQSYENVTASSVSFYVPEPTTMAAENVYTLTLTFDDEATTTRTAKIGVVMGFGTASGTTRCVMPVGARTWNRVRDHAVLPIPYGVTSVNVDGVTMPTGLDGAQGWFALDGFVAKELKPVSIIVDGTPYVAELVGGLIGLVLMLQ